MNKVYIFLVISQFPHLSNKYWNHSNSKQIKISKFQPLSKPNLPLSTTSKCLPVNDQQGFVWNMISSERPASEISSSQGQQKLAVLLELIQKQEGGGGKYWNAFWRLVGSGRSFVFIANEWKHDD